MSAKERYKLSILLTQFFMGEEFYFEGFKGKAIEWFEVGNPLPNKDGFFHCWRVF